MSWAVRASTWSTRCGPQYFLDPSFPVLIAERRPVSHGAPERLQFGVCLRRVDQRQPIRWPRDRPVREPLWSLILFILQARPGPILRSFDQAGPYRVSLDVSADPEKMTIGADRNPVESPLIDCSESGLTVSVLPSPGVGGFEPVHEPGHRAVGLRSEQEMPMGGHDAVGKKCNPDPVNSFFEKPFECGIVAIALEEDRAFCGSIADMKDQSGLPLSSSSRHNRSTEATSMPTPRRMTVLYK